MVFLYEYACMLILNSGWKFRLHLDGLALRAVCCFHQHLAEGRVGVHVAGDLVRGQLHHVRQGQLGQQFGHFRADHVRAQDLAVLRVR